jgi:hypothetical protein
MAISRQAGLPYFDRPRIPPHSSACTERPPFFWLNLARALLLLRVYWLLGLIKKRYRSREKHWLLSLITRRYWSREKRWLLGLITKRYWSREKRRLLGLITKRYWSRVSRLSAVSFFGGAAQFLRAQIPQEFGCSRPVPHLWLVIVLTVPRAQKKKTKRAAGSPAASTQLALCLRLAFDV